MSQRWRRMAVAALAAAACTLAAVSLHAYQAGSSAQSSQPLATADYEVEGVEVALLSVKRVSDGTLTVKWEYRNKTDKPKELGASFDGMGWSEPFSLVYHAYVVDARNRMKYPVLKDEKGNLVAARHAGRKVVVLGPKQTIGTWAKFAAPPADAKKISIFIQGTQPFEEIPISE